MTPTPRRPAPVVPVAAYLVLAGIGLVGTWYFNLRFEPGPDGRTYLAAWFANPASSSAAVDVIVTAVVACLFYLREGWRVGLRWWAVALVPLTFVLALAFTFPLFLAVRELALGRTGQDTDAGTTGSKRGEGTGYP